MMQWGASGGGRKMSLPRREVSRAVPNGHGVTVDTVKCRALMAEQLLMQFDERMSEGGITTLDERARVRTWARNIRNAVMDRFA